MKKFDRETFKQFIKVACSKAKYRDISIHSADGGECHRWLDLFLLQSAEPFLEPGVSEENKKFQKELENVLLEINKLTNELYSQYEYFRWDRYERTNIDGQITGLRFARGEIGNLLEKIKTWRTNEEAR